jgi:hypothetical protein
MRQSSPCGHSHVTIAVMEEDDDFEFEDVDGEFMLSIVNDIDADTAVVVQMAALMLNNDGSKAYLRALDLPLGSAASTLTMAASMIATLAEHLSEHECVSSEQILLELRNWMNDGEGNG